MKTAIKMSFTKPQLIYAVINASTMCLIMSSVTTLILADKGQFWQHWPKVASLDLMVAIPAAICLGPFVRYIVNRLYPNLP